MSSSHLNSHYEGASRAGDLFFCRCGLEMAKRPNNNPKCKVLSPSNINTTDLDSLEMP